MLSFHSNASTEQQRTLVRRLSERLIAAADTATRDSLRHSLSIEIRKLRVLLAGDTVSDLGSAARPQSPEANATDIARR